MVLPGSGKSFDQFRIDDMDCRQYASLQSGGSNPDQAATDSGVKSAAIGAGVGFCWRGLGGRSGAATGAGAGLIVGSVASRRGKQLGTGVQQRYDIGYQQCMYAKGHHAPVYGRFVSPRRSARTYSTAPPSPPASTTPPPPPPGSPPPPPPGAR